MNYLAKRRGDETLRGCLNLADGTKIPFLYKEEKPRKFEEYNAFIQGMEFVLATATISTSTKLALAYNDSITLDNGITLKVKTFQPVINTRRALMSRNNVERWVIDLK